MKQLLRRVDEEMGICMNLGQEHVGLFKYFGLLRAEKRKLSWLHLLRAESSVVFKLGLGKLKFSELGSFSK